MPRPDRPGSRRPGPASARPATEAAHPPRIIGGTLRGRRLAHEPGGGTRPMKDRVRETVFDLLGTAVRGATAIDLFAGTGALGFEALSRGASRAIFAERHFPTADALRRSARELGVEPRCEVRSGDVLLWSRRLPTLPAGAPWIVFVSPPWAVFGAGHERRGELLALVETMRQAAPPSSVLVVEADTGFDAQLLPVADEWVSRPISPAVLHLLHRA